MNEVEIVHERSIKSRQDFIVVYLEDAGNLFGNISNKTKDLLALIWRDCQFSKAKGLYPGNTIELRKVNKLIWCEELKLEIGSVNNMLSQLVKNKILIEIASPIYMLDPKRFFKGSSEHRINAINVVYKYTIEEGI